MYTQCPACKTVFRLHPTQIDAAQGQVRCSRCQTVFNAIANLFQQSGSTALPKEPPLAAGETAPGPDSKASHKDEPARPRKIPPAAAQAAKAAGKPLAGAPQTPAEDPVTQAPATPDEAAIEEEFLLREALAGLSSTEKPEAGNVEPSFTGRDEVSAQTDSGQTSAEETEDNEPDWTLPPNDTRAAVRAEGKTNNLFEELLPEAVEADAKDSAKPSETLAEPPSSHSLPESAPAESPAALTSAEKFDEELLALFDEEGAMGVAEGKAAPETPLQGSLLFEAPTAAEREGKTVAAGEVPDGKATLDDLAPDFSFAEPPAGYEPGTGEASGTPAAAKGGQGQSEESPAAEDLTLPVPDGAAPQTDIDMSGKEQESPGYSLPLEQTKERSGLLSTLVWGVGIVLMLAGLVLQYLYYNRMAFAEDQRLRPVLAQMCELTGCQLPLRRDLSKIELGNHLVQYHPRYEHSLLITATLINRADFNQPFPIVEVVMTDLEQHVVARRRFLPDEYLVGDNAAQGMPPGVEVPLMLEVLDPGKNAVGFEFNFY